MRHTIGIDNGLFGAVVLLDRDSKLVRVEDTPIMKVGKRNRYTIPAMAGIIHSMVDGLNCEPLVVIEEAYPMPGQGSPATFSTGLGYGLWQGILAGMCLPYHTVHPRTWTKKMLLNVPDGKPKERSMYQAQKLFPDLELTKPSGRKPTLDGRADAALIALYGQWHLQ